MVYGIVDCCRHFIPQRNKILRGFIFLLFIDFVEFPLCELIWYRVSSLTKGLIEEENIDLYEFNDERYKVLKSAILS